jgi:CheY-like chemotaxis protein
MEVCKDAITCELAAYQLQNAELINARTVIEKAGVGVFWLELMWADGLPPALDRGEPAALATKIYEQTQHHTLMYIEDDPASLLLIEYIIESRPDIHLLSAMYGYAGIKLAGANQPDVILMDINLTGGLSRIETLKVLRGASLTAHIPVIALSANVMPHDIAQALEAGFFRYLTKPIKLNEFMSAIDEALEFAEGQSLRKNRGVMEVSANLNQSQSNLTIHL